MLDDYIRRCMPRRITVLGQELLPFSLGHYKRLIKAHNWFILPEEEKDKKELGLGDLVQGVFVCCQTWDEFEKEIRDPKLDKKLAKWGRRCAGTSFLIESALFGDYLTEGMDFPTAYPASNTEVKPCGASFLERVEVVLRGRLGHTRIDAMDKPWSEAVSNFFCLFEMEGLLSIVGDDWKEVVDNVKEMDLAADRLRKKGIPINSDTIAQEMLERN